MVGGQKSKGKQVAKKHKKQHGDNSEFILTHFPHPPIRKCFHDKFMSRSALTPYFANLDNLENLAICDKSISDFLVDMGWTNALVLKEQYYPNLVKVFYLNMLISSQTTNRIITSVGGFLLSLMLLI